MPLIKRAEKMPEARRLLVSQLVTEWSAPTASLDNPIIICEEGLGNLQAPLTIRVVWDAWRGLSDEERTGVIIDAFAALDSTDAEDLLRVVAAEGLTIAEADALGIDYTSTSS